MSSLRPCGVCHQGYCKECLPLAHRLSYAKQEDLAEGGEQKNEDHHHQRKLRTASGTTASIRNTDTVNCEEQYVCESCVHEIFPACSLYAQTQDDRDAEPPATSHATSHATSAGDSGSDDIFLIEDGCKFAKMCAFSYTRKTDDVHSLNEQIQQEFNCDLVAWRSFSDGTGFFIARDSTTLFVVFRGTCNVKNIETDSRFMMKKFPTFAGQLFKNSRVHEGFLDSYLTARLEMLALVRGVLNEQQCPVDLNVVVCGHSLGGALATLACLDLKTTLVVGPLADSSRLSSYTFGCPRVGNLQFADAYNLLVPKTARVANENDVVAKLPLRSFLYPYKHTCTLVRVERGTGTVVVAPPRSSKVINFGLVFGVDEHVKYFDAVFPSNPFQ